MRYTLRIVSYSLARGRARKFHVNDYNLYRLSDKKQELKDFAELIHMFCESFPEEIIERVYEV